jgi:anti-sigma regulatory factor (Ser/Thr protein kinase)
MSELLDQPVVIAIRSIPAHLPVVRSALDRFCELLGFREEDRGLVVLAVDEALTNIIRHAYRGRSDQRIEITLRCTNGSDGRAALQIQLRDWGEPVRPEQFKSRPLQEIRPGGLGVHIMGCCMDNVEYHPAPEGGTCLTMTKLAPGESQS